MRSERANTRYKEPILMKIAKLLISAVVAGFSVGLGGLVFLSVESKVVGGVMFTLGLFCVCTFGLNLFTGKVCYVFQNDAAYALRLPLIWIGNVIGTGLVAGLASLTRSGAAFTAGAARLCEVKLSDSFLSLFVLGMFCNIFICIAVEGYNNNPHEVGKYISLFMGVTCFVLCGMEHCVADMFYLWMAGAMGLRSLPALLVISLGNAAGGVLLPLAKGFIKKE